MTASLAGSPVPEGFLASVIRSTRIAPPGVFGADNRQQLLNTPLLMLSSKLFCCIQILRTGHSGGVTICESTDRVNQSRGNNPTGHIIAQTGRPRTAGIGPTNSGWR